jgi:hypothetical protein
VDAGGNIVDEVAWSAAKDPAAPVQYLCTSQSCDAYRNFSFTRASAANGAYLIGDADWQLLPTSPVSSALVPGASASLQPQNTAASGLATLPFGATTCEGIIITELLPNPSSVDTGKEYIELHNPTGQAISLNGCSLKTSASGKVFELPADNVLHPGQYYAYYDSQTGLTMTNSSGGTVWLLSPTAELQSVTYPGNLGSDEAWTLDGGLWAKSFSASPNTPNVVTSSKPCTIGQSRNAETNRCQSVSALAASALSSCKAGQERNPETNRCRSVLGAVAGLVPCKANQIRSPVTNRCRGPASTAAALKACKENQERNPQTNRCRNVPSTGNAASGMAEVKDVGGDSLAGSPKWWLAGIATAGAIGYGGYEWRQELARHLARLKQKLPFRSFK